MSSQFWMFLKTYFVEHIQVCCDWRTFRGSRRVGGTGSAFMSRSILPSSSPGSAATIFPLRVGFFDVVVRRHRRQVHSVGVGILLHGVRIPDRRFLEERRRVSVGRSTLHTLEVRGKLLMVQPRAFQIPEHGCSTTSAGTSG